MLVLFRQVGQSIQIGDDITVKVHSIKKSGRAVRLAIDAPQEIKVWRPDKTQELKERPDRGNQ